MQKRLLTAIIFFNLFVLFLTTALAQGQSENANITWGKEYNEPPNSRTSKIVAIQKTGFYVLREKTNNERTYRPKVYIEHYDRQMNLKKSEAIDLRYKGKQRDFEDLIMLGGKLYLLSSFNNQGKRKNYLFKQEISSRSLVPSKSLDMIAETEAKNKEREGTFDLHISKDSSKLLIYNQLPYDKKEPERFALRVFDNQFEELWAKEIALPYPDHEFKVEEYRVDEMGNVYLLGVHFKDGVPMRRRGQPNYQYVILAYTKNGTDIGEYRIDLKEKFITDLTFRVADNGDLVCSGFYSERGTFSIKGTYFFRLNPTTKEIFNKNLKAFDFEFLTEYYSPKDKEKAKQAERKGNTRREAELYDFSLDELILRSDGGAVLVAEQYYVYERNDYDYYPASYGSLYSPYNRTTTYYNYNDIIVVNIRPTGEIEWTARIPKRQVTTNDGGYFSSYAMSIVRDRLYFIYNDNGRNFDTNRKGNRQFNFNGRQSVIVLAEIKKGGAVNFTPLYSNSDAEIITRPKICKQIGSREMAIYGENGRRFRFASLKFK